MSKVQRSKANVVCALISVAVLAARSLDCFAQTNAPARLSYDSFRTISDRNIFNPNRYAAGPGRTARTNSPPAARVESFSLVGIMAYQKGSFAFFDGTKSDYKQALQADGVIGDYKVISVTPDAVKIAAGTNTFDLKVGMQMRREDEGDWFLSEGGDASRRRLVSTRTRVHGTAAGSDQETRIGSEPEVIVIEGDAQSETTTGETPSANGTGNVSSEAADGVTDPVLLRLMQRRQELNQ